MSKAIVLVAFGSVNLEGIKQSIGLLEDDLNEYLFIQNYSDEKREINLEEYCLKDIINNNKISNKILLNPYDVVICEKEK